MAIIPKEKTKKQKYLIFVLAAIVIIGVSVVWLNFLQEPELLPISLLPEEPKKIEINFEILKSQILKELQPFLKIPPFEGEMGRKNPFISYE